MEKIILKTNINCKNCIRKIEPILQNDNNISIWKFDLLHQDKLMIVEGNNINTSGLISKLKEIGYFSEIYQGNPTLKFKAVNIEKSNFWANKTNWKRASFNTLNCLIGCSIGDFGMIFFLQAYFPETSMLIQMILAVISGLTTSIILETIILRKRENFNWSLALKTAFSMSFISMIGMELAMNFTDFMITGGKAAFNTLKYWLAIIPALISGFLFPLPYNYFKLQKFGKSCH